MDNLPDKPGFSEDVEIMRIDFNDIDSMTLFSEWRKYVKCELSYDQFDLDFIFRVMDTLESRYI